MRKMKKWNFLAIFSMLVILFLIPSLKISAHDEVFDYQIMNGAADPFVTLHEGNYYMVFTQVNKIEIYKSPNLADISQGEVIRAFTPPEEGWGSKNIWAPKLHHIDGKWYLYYTADDGIDANHRMYVLENNSSDPMSDSWESKGEIENMPDTFAIDGNVFEHDGKSYMVWSTRTDGIMELWMDEMINPWTIRGEPVIISTPTYDWEKVDGAVNEGPAILKRNGRIFMTYSGTGCQSPDYSIGMLTASDTSDLLDPDSWTKSPDPVFSKNPENDVYGPGHNSFTTSPDGTEDWMVYHANSSPDAGCTGARGARVQKIDWHDDGTPDFGTPQKVQVLVDCIEGRYEAQDAVINNAVVQDHNQQASCGMHVGNMDFDDSYVEFPQVYAPYTGQYEMTINYAHGMESASHFVTINDGSSIEVPYQNTGWGNWSETTIEVELQEGLNTVQFRKGLNFSELNYITFEEMDDSDRSLKAPLQANVDELQLLVEAHYTSTSWGFLQNALQETQKGLIDSKMNQQELNRLFDRLVNASNQLKRIDDASDGSPHILNAAISADSPDRLMLSFDEPITLEYASGFHLLGTEGINLVSSVNYRLKDQGKTLMLRLSREVLENEILSLSYDHNRGSIETEFSSMSLTSFRGKKVINWLFPTNIEGIQHLIDQYKDLGDIEQPMFVKLTNKLKQAKHQLDKGSKSRAIKHIEDFIKHLNNKGMAKFISVDAKETLHQKANDLIQIWTE